MWHGRGPHSPRTWLPARLPSQPGEGVQGHRVTEQSLGAWLPGAPSDRRICPRHADNNQASGASKAEGHTNAPDTGNGASGQPAMLPCYAPGTPCILQMVAPVLSPHTCQLVRAQRNRTDSEIQVIDLQGQVLRNHSLSVVNIS